jgi:hypothetical protein
MSIELRQLYWPGPFRGLYQALQAANAASAPRVRELLSARQDWLLLGLAKFQPPSDAARAAAKDGFKAGKLVLSAAGAGEKGGGQRITLDARMETATLEMSAVLVRAVGLFCRAGGAACLRAAAPRRAVAAAAAARCTNMPRCSLRNGAVQDGGAPSTAAIACSNTVLKPDPRHLIYMYKHTIITSFPGPGRSADGHAAAAVCGRHGRGAVAGRDAGRRAGGARARARDRGGASCCKQLE